MDTKPKPTTPHSGGHAEVALGHVVELRVLLAVFAALMVLTVITVAVSYFDFGALNLLVAMVVATIKASLVALFFMHLRYDSAFNGFIFVVGFAFLGLFLVITMLDAIESLPDVQQWQRRNP